MEDPLSPQGLAAYDAWCAKAYDAEVPVYGTAWVLLSVAGMAYFTAALLALVLVVLGMLAGKLWWFYEHSGEAPGHTA